MGTHFKRDMFITSFIPLWISILSINIWTIVEFGISVWYIEEKTINKIFMIWNGKSLEIVVALIVLFVPIASAVSISKFINDQLKIENKPKAKITRAVKANKLTSEFLLAYILPMIAFDFSEPKDIFLFLVYFLVLALLCIRNDNIYTNIYLELKGYKLYECDIERMIAGEKKVYENTLLISKYDVTEPINRDIDYWDFENYIYINIKGDL